MNDKLIEEIGTAIGTSVLMHSSIILPDAKVEATAQATLTAIEQAGYEIRKRDDG